MEYVYTSNSQEDTLSFAKQFAEKLNKDDVIILSGELGSGKTKFVEGILSYFNLENQISSPTFTIVNQYDAENFPIYHFDVYRLKNISEFYELGGDEYFGNGLCLIEWGEMIEEALPEKYIEISFEKSDVNVRTIKICYRGVDR